MGDSQDTGDEEAVKRAVPESLRAALAARKDGNPLAGYSVPLVVSYGGGINSAAMLVGKIGRAHV